MLEDPDTYRTLLAQAQDEGEDVSIAESRLGLQRSIFDGMGREWKGATRKQVDRNLEAIWKDYKNNAIPHEPFAMIHRDKVSDLESGRWHPSKFAVYVAVVSMIGKKTLPWILRYDEIQRRADGFTKSTAPEGYVPSLTASTVRRRIAQLEKTNLVSTFSLSRGRSRWYWLPSQCDRHTAEAYIIRRLALRAPDKAELNEQRARIVREVQEIRQPGKQTESNSNPTGTRQVADTNPTAINIPSKHSQKAFPESVPLKTASPTAMASAESETVKEMLAKARQDLLRKPDVPWPPTIGNEGVH